jgi:catechol 2,3-dioxygenase-like lactoylglutathione lyase family enzyme
VSERTIKKGFLPFLKGGIAQVALVVGDLEATVEKYWRLCGIGPWHFYTYEAPLLKRMTYMGEPVKYSIRIALSYVGALRIELIQHLRGPTVHHDFVLEKGYGVHHFGLLVDDMQEAIREAEAAGYHIIQDGAGFGLDGDGHFAYLDTEDELGITIELIQRPKGRVQPEKIYPPAEV